jgi:hypothetical protein
MHSRSTDGVTGLSGSDAINIVRKAASLRHLRWSTALGALAVSQDAATLAAAQDTGCQVRR